MTGPAGRDNRGGVVLGLVLIALGGLFLVDRVTGIDLADAGWPLFVIVPGVLLLRLGPVDARPRGRRAGGRRRRSRRSSG